MNAFEQPLSKIEQPETRRYEYKDAAGKKIADVEADFASSGDMVEDPSGGEAVPAKRLVRMILENPEDGRRFDVLTAFNRHRADVVVPEKRIANYSHGVMGSEAIVPSPASPIDLATMLHELGHVDQYEDPEFQAVANFSGVSKPFFGEMRLDALGGRDDAETIRLAQGHLQAVLEAIPDARENADADALAAFAAAGTLEALKAAAAKIQDVLVLPLRMAERDATRRALRGLRRIRDEAGIDLLVKTINPKEALSGAGEGCEATTAAGFQDADRYVTVSTLQAMKDDLKTYGAERFRPRKSEGTAG